MTMRAIIVDDEELARRGIRALLKRAGDVEIVSERGGAGTRVPGHPDAGENRVRCDCGAA